LNKQNKQNKTKQMQTKQTKGQFTLSIGVSTLLLTALTGSLQASLTTIDGTISFSGTATTDTSSLLTSTKFTRFQDVVVGSPAALSGDYVSTSGASVTVTPFTWNPPGASTPINPLWTLNSGGDTYSFNLSSLHQDFASPTAMVLSGMGTAFITGPGADKLPTTGLWSLTTQTFGESTFTFSSSSTVSAVPEPSTFIAGGLLALPFGFKGIRRLRNRKTV
jgi:hypothetical protein